MRTPFRAAETKRRRNAVTAALRMQRRRNSKRCQGIVQGPMLKAANFVTAGLTIEIPQGPQPPENVTVEELERLQEIHRYLHQVQPRIIETAGRPGAPVLSRPEAGGHRIRNLYVEDDQRLRVAYEE